MKDKRQRITAAWPYAAVYADPAFAASILQAAANSVAMPFGYPQNAMLNQLPHSMSHQMQTTSPYMPYGYSRYTPYPIPAQRNPSSIPTNNNYNTIMNNQSVPQGYQPISKSHTPPHEHMPSPSSPNSSLSLSPGSDKQLFSPQKPLAASQPIPHHHLSHHQHQQYHQHPPMGLLMTTNSPQSTSSSSSPPIHSAMPQPPMQRLESPPSATHQTQVKELTEKPKLFKPYKSS